MKSKTSQKQLETAIDDYKNFISKASLDDIAISDGVRVFDYLRRSDILKYYKKLKKLKEGPSIKILSSDIMTLKFVSRMSFEDTYGLPLLSFEINHSFISKIDIYFYTCTHEFLILDYYISYDKMKCNIDDIRKTMFETYSQINFIPKVYTNMSCKEESENILDFMKKYSIYHLQKLISKDLFSSHTLPCVHNYFCSMSDINKKIKEVQNGDLRSQKSFYYKSFRDKILFLFNYDFRVSYSNDGNRRFYFELFSKGKSESFYYFFGREQQVKLSNIVDKYLTKKSVNFSGGYELLHEEYRSALETIQTWSEDRNKHSIKVYLAKEKIINQTPTIVFKQKEFFNNKANRTFFMKDKIELYLRSIDTIVSSRLSNRSYTFLYISLVVTIILFILSYFELI